MITITKIIINFWKRFEYCNGYFVISKIFYYAMTISIKLPSDFKYPSGEESVDASITKYLEMFKLQICINEALPN